MGNHPNRKHADNPSGHPSAAEVRQAREEAKLTQTEAADLVHTTVRVWQQWESTVEGDARRMHPATWELFLVKSSAVLRKSHKLVAWLSENIGDRDVPSSYRSRATGTCFTIVRDHHAAIVHLIDENHPSPAFTLARSVFEGYVRASWLFHRATDTQVDQFLDGKDIRDDASKKKLRIADLIAELENTASFLPDSLSAIKDKAWDALCDYAHVGGRLVSHWNKPGSVEINFSPADVDAVLHLTGIIAALAGLGMLELAHNEVDDELAAGILAQVKEFSPLEKSEQ